MVMDAAGNLRDIGEPEIDGLGRQRQTVGAGVRSRIVSLECSRGWSTAPERPEFGGILAVDGGMHGLRLRPGN